MKEADPNRCPALRNPGVWPYVARCILPAGHDGPHADETQEWAP